MKVLLKLFFAKIIRPLLEPIIIRLFHFFWYHSPDTWRQNTFLGYQILQCPFDLQLYQEVIFRTKPDFILQTGVAGGGSLLYFASLLDLINASANVKVIGIDILITTEAKKLTHPRIQLIEGSSTDEKTVSLIKQLTEGKKGIVILDSDHSKKHVLKELSIYQEFVEPGYYVVVEDCNINGHPVSPFSGNGPYEAVQEFLLHNNSLIQDNTLWKRNKFSFHQFGWLKKIS